MKKIILIVLLSLGANIYAQMIVSAPTLDALLSSILSIDTTLSKKKLESMSVKEKNRLKEQIKHVKRIKEMVYTVKKIGSIANAGGQNLQDLMDTTNDISNLMRQSIVFNKGIDELTREDQKKALEEINRIRAEASKTTNDLDKLIKNTTERIGNTHDTAQEFIDMITHFDPTENPQNFKLDMISKEMSKANKALESMGAILQGQAIEMKINKELDKKESEITDKNIEIARNNEKSKYNSYIEDLKNAIPDEDTLLEDLGFDKNKKIEKGTSVWKNLNGTPLKVIKEKK